VNRLRSLEFIRETFQNQLECFLDSTLLLPYTVTQRATFSIDFSSAKAKGEARRKKLLFIVAYFGLSCTQRASMNNLFALALCLMQISEYPIWFFRVVWGGEKLKYLAEF
jgi:hypothetical protein